MVAVRNSGHFGAAGVYAAMAAERGMIGIGEHGHAGSPRSCPRTAPTRELGTNPIAFAAPGDAGPPFELDMATTTASLGRVLGAWRRGRRLPSGLGA